MLEYNLGKRIIFFYFISFYKVGDLNIIMETNGVYLCTQTQIYSKNSLNEF
jgi:hypothetical protein